MNRSAHRVQAVAAGFVLLLLAALVVTVLVGRGDGADGGRGGAGGAPTSSGPAPTGTGAPLVTGGGEGSETGSAGTGSGSGDDEDEGDEDEGDEDREPVNQAGAEVDARAGDVTLPAVRRVACPPGGSAVRTAAELEQALADAGPGDVIRLADGTYSGEFVASASGTAERPVWLCGGRGAVLRGPGTGDGYVLHLDGADHWRLVGFTVTDGQKGVMADGTTGSVLQDLSVTQIGDEAIHLRRASTDNLVIGNEVSGTGLRKEKFGEGVYIGTAVSNWCEISDCLPDRSDRNVIAQNRFRDTTAENIDIKEGTTHGLVVGNEFDGAGTVEADSWVDVKGTAWTVTGNSGTDAPLDGFQTHQIEERWGERNVFSDNTIEGPAASGGEPGYGIAVRPEADNVVRCDNSVSGGIELSNVSCG